MSYTVLARKYRSKVFDELVGQEHIARTLTRAIESGRIAHAYLFCGTRGTGKTSTARILAKCLNCQTADAPTANPCGKCESCKAISIGQDMDVVEIDAASNTQVDKTREVIIDNAAYRPAHGRFKIYIIDEVHMLSKSSFNALLKTLEEPPEHVKFILATTEPEKILPTILSRCQRYDFRNIPTREIAGHLQQIVKEEKIDADEEALRLVARAGAGSMRDSLSLLDRLLTAGEKKLTIELVEQMLGLPRAQLLYDLAQAIGEARPGEVLKQADNILSAGMAADTLISSLIEHFRNLLILRTCGADSSLVDVPGIGIKELEAQAARFDPIVLTQDIALLEELRRQLRSSQAGRALLDAALVRLTLADQFTQIAELLEPEGESSGAAAPAGTSLKKKYEPALTTTPAPAENPPPRVDTDEDDALPAVGRVWEASAGPSLSELLKQRSAGPSADASPEPVTSPQPQPAAEGPPPPPHDLPGLWQAMLDRLVSHGPMLMSVVQSGRLVSIQDGQAVIRYGSRHETFVRMLDRNGRKDLLREALSQASGQTLGVRFEIDPDPEPEPEPATAPAREAETAHGNGARPSAVSGHTTTIAPAARPAPRMPVRREIDSAPRAPEPAPVNLLRITPELIESLRAEAPLIKSLMDDLGATIVKVESAAGQA